ncbi:hypothetical protein [Methylorubrum extorquens]
MIGEFDFDRLATDRGGEARHGRNMDRRGQQSDRAGDAEATLLIRVSKPRLR